MKRSERVGGCLGLPVNVIKERNEALHEFNPMLGHRGCRLAVTYPEIYLMQVRAIVEAAIESDKAGIKVIPEIMIPLISELREYDFIQSTDAKLKLKKYLKRKIIE